MTAPAASALDASGAVLSAALVATPDAVSTTVTPGAGDSRQRFTLASVAGIERGREYLVTDTVLGEMVVEVAAVDAGASTVTLVSMLPDVPVAGSAFEGIEVAVELDAASTAATGQNLRIVVGDGTTEAMLVYNVVRHPWISPVTARTVRDFVTIHWESDPLLDTAEGCLNISERASQRVRQELIERGVYASYFWDASAFREPAMVAAKSILAERGMVPPGRDPDAYVERLDLDFARRIGRIVRSATPYDADDSGGLDASEARPMFTIELTR